MIVTQVFKWIKLFKLPSLSITDNYKFTFLEIIKLTLGRTNYVERNQHKGFDYDHLIYDVRKYFDVVSVSGYSTFFYLPKFLSFGVGIVAKTKK